MSHCLAQPDLEVTAQSGGSASQAKGQHRAALRKWRSAQGFAFKA
jgi:hypothetical protein